MCYLPPWTLRDPLNFSSRTPIPYSCFWGRLHFPSRFVYFYRSKYRSYFHEYSCNVPNIFIPRVRQVSDNYLLWRAYAEDKSFVPVVYDKSTVVISAGNAPAREGPRTRSASWYGPVELGLGEGTSRSCWQNFFRRTPGQTMLIY